MKRTLGICLLTTGATLLSAGAYANPTCINGNNELAWLQAPPQRVLAGTHYNLQAEWEASYSGNIGNWQVWFGTPSSQFQTVSSTSTWTTTGKTCSPLGNCTPQYPSTSDVFPGAASANNLGNVTTYYQIVTYTYQNVQYTTCISDVVYAQNNLPTASVVNVGWGQANASTGLLGGGTIDPQAQNSQLSYTWDFGDGSAAGSGQSVTHTYGSTGTYTVTLQTNDGYFTASTTRQVKVVNEGLDEATVPWNIAAGIM